MLTTVDTYTFYLYSKIILRTAHQWDNTQACWKQKNAVRTCMKMPCILKEQGKDKNIAVLL